MKIKIKKLHGNAKIPEYATDGAACFDIKPIKVDFEYQSVIIQRNEKHVFRTGLAFEIPKGYAMLLFSRSGHGFKHDARLANCVGMIDSDYRGEVMVKITKDSGLSAPLKIDTNTAIAQAMIVPADRVEFEIADDLSETERGEGGFGSTDKKQKQTP